MACALKAELKCKDGQTRTFTVDAENNLKSIIEGVKKMNAEISVVLTELVEEEKSLNTGGGDRRVHDEEDDDEDDDDDDDDEDDEDDSTEAAAVPLKSEPPAKRLKSVAPS